MNTTHADIGTSLAQTAAVDTDPMTICLLVRRITMAHSTSHTANYRVTEIPLPQIKMHPKPTQIVVEQTEMLTTGTVKHQ